MKRTLLCLALTPIALAQAPKPIFDGRLTLQPGTLSAEQQAFLKRAIFPAARKEWHDQEAECERGFQPQAVDVAHGAFTRPGAAQDAILYRYCTIGHDMALNGIAILQNGQLAAHVVYQGDESHAIGALPDINGDGISEIVLAGGSTNQGITSSWISILQLGAEMTRFGHTQTYEDNCGVAEGNCRTTAWRISVKPGPAPGFFREAFAQDGKTWKRTAPLAALKLDADETEYQLLSGHPAPAAGENHNLLLKKSPFFREAFMADQAERPTPGGHLALAAGERHGLLLQSDGTVWAWGDNGFDGWEPVRVPGLTGIRAIAAGGGFSLAVKGDGTLWTWGTDNAEQPRLVAGIRDLVAISAAEQRALALDSHGTVWEWRDVPVDGPAAPPKQVTGLSGVRAIAASDRHSVALTSDGGVWVWGDHGAGDQGNGVYSNSAVPLRLRGFSDIVAIGAAYQLTIALKQDGTVWTIGYGAAGGLGNSATVNSSTTPVMVKGLTGVKAIAGGYMHACALKGDGTVWCWGYNHDHQLGDTRLATDASNVPVRAGTLARVAAIAAAKNHSAAVTADGTVWTWGQNNGGALGADPDDLDRSDVPMRAGQEIPPACRVLFTCLTESGKEIRICGNQDDAAVDKWTAIHYRYGPESGPPELMFPKDPETAPPSLYFADESRGSDYRVSIRFTSGAYTYRVFSGSKSGAGVTVEDGKGKVVSNISCAERPEMYAEYLRENLPCDPKGPRGAAGCKAK
jgi:alpha-tubulin suppressor-like RCC1 family protein